MKLKISKEWILKLANYSPNSDVKDAAKFLYKQHDRFKIYIGDYVLSQIINGEFKNDDS